MKNRKGISPLIATLLLIAIAVAASVLTYSWVMSMIGSQSGQAQTQIRVDGVDWGSAAIVVSVRNTGSIDAQIESVWVRPNTAGSNWLKDDFTSPESVAVGKAGDINCAPTGMALDVNTSYVIRVTTTSGFYYEYVGSTPAVFATS